MSEKNNATCSICGKGYYKCLSCKDMMTLNPWKKYTCTSEHYKVHQILHGYNTKVYSKDEAKIKLQMVDLSDFDTLRDNIKDIINEIMSEDKKIVEEPIVEIVVEPETIDMSVEEIKEKIEENLIIEPMVEKPKVARKKKSFEKTEEILPKIEEVEFSEIVETE